MPFPPPERSTGEGRSGATRQLAFAAAAVLLAAADTYVVVAVLPSIMGGVGLTIDQLQRATPIISGFLLGYTVVLPLLGRLADAVGRVPVFVACLAGFGLGSLLTATAHDLGVLVAGRALQGLGGGGLVPVTLALVAAQWPVETRGLPLGVVGAVQELGSVIGPLYGAAIAAVSTWRNIFWINLPIAAVVGIGFVVARPRPAARRAPGPVVRPGRRDLLGPGLLAVGAVGLGIGLDSPAWLADSVRFGWAAAPWVGGPAWVELSAPITVVAAAVVVAGLAWEVTAPFGTRPVIPLRRVPGALREVDLVGAGLLAVVLGCVVILFSTEDPSRQVIASGAPVLIPVGVVALGGFAWWQRRAAHPLIPPRLLAPRPAWGALVVNLAIGAALMAALVDVPVFARVTTQAGSQLGAAEVLVRFLVAVPVGAVIGGLACRRASRGPAVAAVGAALAAIGFVAMSRWGAQALARPWHVAGASLGLGASDLALVVCGLGFGLTIAPVNAAILAAVPERAHGLASSLVVVSRTIGMLAGLSSLTAIGLRRFYEAQAKVSPLTLCPGHPTSCPAYERATAAALLSELHTIFVGAAICAGAAAVTAGLLLRPPRRP